MQYSSRSLCKFESPLNPRNPGRLITCPRPQLVAAREESQQSVASAAAAEAAAAESATTRRRAEANAAQAAENLRAAEAEVDLVSQQNEQMFRYVRHYCTPYYRVLRSVQGKNVPRM